MTNEHLVSRREFTVETVLAMLAGNHRSDGPWRGRTKRR